MDNSTGFGEYINTSFLNYNNESAAVGDIKYLAMSHVMYKVGTYISDLSTHMG